MKTIIIIGMLFSFMSNLGGEQYSIYLNNDLLTQQVIAHQDKVPAVRLGKATQGNISIHYDHCGQIGTSRTLSLRIGENNVIKTWNFDDALSVKSRMTVDVNEITRLLQKQSPATLIYSSKELSTDRVLATFVLDNETTVAKTE